MMGNDSKAKDALSLTAVRPDGQEPKVVVEMR